jgi:hypothetical protein
MSSTGDTGAVGAEYTIETEAHPYRPTTQYRKKPVTIDAWLIKDVVDRHFGLEGQPDPIAHAISVHRLRPVLNGIYIDTLEGGMFGRLEDYLIRGVAGEFYPCKPDIFFATYEPVTP